MIGRLTGKVIEEDDGTTVIDVNGVGYELVTPLGTIGRAAADADGRVTLFVHTHVREDVFSLFGFASEGDRVAFRTLIGVSSVGPKTAISVLSALPAHELGQAIAQKQLGKLTSISGIGKKTAERLLLELKDKLSILHAAPPAKAGAKGQAAAAAPPASSHGDVLARALVNMGYKQSEADRAVEQLAPRIAEGAALTDLVKEALALLSK
ncbi:MAG: Holliday junction branch migration protein RuvA [Labilithrix sp.]|nr:Holliday junction branch migration protein RuvA [Labilithrix sp.]MCW5810046.1 Holliday junction branch migration protein RuvA [Labilithrix sp.]